MACENCPIIHECVARELFGLEVLEEISGNTVTEVPTHQNLSTRDAAMVDLISNTIPEERLGFLVDQEVCQGPRKQFFAFGKKVCAGSVYVTLDGKTPFPMDVTRKLK